MNELITNVHTLRAVLEKNGIEPDYSLGQNFLVSEEVVEATILAITNAPRQATELGSGAGAVTQMLAMHDFKVRAIEKDDQLADLLPKIIPAKKRNLVEVLHKDLKDVRWEWESPYCIVGNIPYNLSGLVIRRLTQLNPTPHSAVLLVQKEVGQRLMENPPNMSLLSLAIALWGKAEKLVTVPPNCFWPQPKIHSQLVLLTPHQTPTADEQEREHIMSFAKIFFQQKRKQIGGLLQQHFHVTQPEMENLLQKAGATKQSRPQELSAHQWKTLAENVRTF